MDTTLLLSVLLAVLLAYVQPLLYIVFSLILLWNPRILHTTKRLRFFARNIAHRGGAGEKIENTMEAFNHAVEVEADMLELDCHMTKDGKVVVSHDGNLLRQTGNDVMISSLNMQDLPLYKERLEVTFNTGHYSTGQDRKFVLLEDVFQKFPTMPINIEVKDDNDILIEKVASLVRSYRRDAITVWATDSDHLMSKCREQNPDMPFIFTLRRGILVLILFYTGLLPFVPLREDLLQFYLPQVINRKYIPEPSDPLILRCRPLLWLVEKLAMRKALFEHLVKRGIEVHLFVCNEESDIDAAFSLGATAVMTDYPSLLSDWLRRHPQPPPTHPHEPPRHPHTPPSIVGASGMTVHCRADPSNAGLPFALIG
ncbi:lysophospholipase D GDPD1 [Alosa pseudoharengus]|uniref:lysophospholipase D GDPD1 n=1 Tax=Alosa pseudoharengus TaxID=34774 RepID=UPI003F8CD50B